MRYLLRRLIVSLLTVWLVVTLSFFLVHTLPGNPFATKELLNIDMQQRLLRYYGLDRPLVEQYAVYMGNLLRGNLGFSYRNPGQSVNSVILASFPISARIGLAAFIPGVLLGVVLGVASVIHRDRVIDRGIVTFSVINAALPVFILASLLQYVFATKWRLLPSARWGTPSQMVLPVLSIMIGVCAAKARAMRTMLVEVSGEDYMRVGRARGLSPRRLMYRHGVRNALIPLMSSTGMELANVLTGTFVVEQVYAIPGFGTMYVNAVKSLDYSVILGMTIFYTALIVTLNFLVDALYCVIDPRIRLSAGKGASA